MMQFTQMHEESISATNLMLTKVLVQICCVKASENKWLSSMLDSPDPNDIYQVSSQAVQVSG